MKIVILDGHTLNPGDLSWKAFEELGEVVVYERSSPEEVIERSLECDALITNKAIVSSQAIQEADNLKYIGVTATGVNIVDIDAASEKGVPVCNVAGYGPDSVAQMVFAHVLNLVHRLASQADDVRKGGVVSEPGFLLLAASRSRTEWIDLWHYWTGRDWPISKSHCARFRHGGDCVHAGRKSSSAGWCELEESGRTLCRKRFYIPPFSVDSGDREHRQSLQYFKNEAKRVYFEYGKRPVSR